MNIILLESIPNLGVLGDQVSVKAGYGRNYLIPKGKAVFATKENQAHFETRRAELEAKAAASLAEAEKRKTAIEALNVTIESNAGDEGKLFGSIGTRDIADAVTQAGAAIEKHEVRMPEGAIRLIGDYDIELSLHTDVVATVKVAVVAAKSE